MTQCHNTNYRTSTNPYAYCCGVSMCLMLPSSSVFNRSHACPTGARTTAPISTTTLARAAAGCVLKTCIPKRAVPVSPIVSWNVCSSHAPTLRLSDSVANRRSPLPLSMTRLIPVFAKDTLVWTRRYRTCPCAIGLCARSISWKMTVQPLLPRMPTVPICTPFTAHAHSTDRRHSLPGVTKEALQWQL